LHFLPATSPNKSVIVISDCAQGGAIRSNKYVIILSNTWGKGFCAGKQLSVDTDEHGNKLEKTADTA
jgi:hypothetical protein